MRVVRVIITKQFLHLLSTRKNYDVYLKDLNGYFLKEE